MAWSTTESKFRAHLASTGRSSATIAITLAGMRRFRAFLARHRTGWARVTTRDVEMYREGMLVARLSPRTVDTYLRAVKRFYRWCAMTERIAVDPMTRFRFASLPKALPRAVPTRRDMRRLLAEPDISTGAGLRDRAVIEVLYSSGIRVSELCRLDIDDVDLCGGFVRVLRGKGGKDRVVPLGHRAGAAVRDYLRCARNPPRDGRGRNGLPLFLGAQGRRIQPPAVERAVRDCARRAGIAMRLTPHSLRHAFATHLLQGGASIVHVQRMLGHASLTSTQIYLRVTVNDVRRTHARTHPGDRGRDQSDRRGEPWNLHIF